MCDPTAEDGAIVNVHVKPTLFPCSVDEFKEGRGKESGKDWGEGGTLGGAVI